MQGFEKREDEKREKILRDKLYRNLNLLQNIYNDAERIVLLEMVVDIYNTLKIEACSIDEKDYNDKKKELYNLKYRIMQEIYKQSSDYKSWEEYKKEEDEIEKYQEDDDESR